VRPEGCQDFFDRLDEKVEEERVRDAATVQVCGFPYLRTNRFLAALGENLNDAFSKDQWVQWMQQLDLDAREKEIQNLPDQAVMSLIPKVPGHPDRKALFEQVQTCSAEILHSDRSRPNFFEVLQPRVHVPDEYSFGLRTVGLYPFMTIPVAIATYSARQKARSWFNMKMEDLPIAGKLVTYVPAEMASPDEIEVGKILAESKKNPLGVPLPDTLQENRLVTHFAPILVQDMVGPYDRLGQIRWQDDRVGIDLGNPTVYYYLSHAFLEGKPILQINYVIWYSERAGDRSPRIEHGHLDGLTMRVSLDDEGSPFMVDVVNDCGCYHFFVPRRGQVQESLTRPFMFDPLVPQWLPSMPPGKRLAIRANSGWHQIERLFAIEEPADAVAYTLVPYDRLENLPHEGGQTESIFDPDGIVKGTERVERFILFSMGIPSIGSMRQRGHHAIELIGRAHFDDPRLFDRSFVFK
jgi:hypothetical protein